ncbi:hypothetical protein KJ966_28620 [bacterium]|nr:hypothetical protein [bacterium]
MKKISVLLILFFGIIDFYSEESCCHATDLFDPGLAEISVKVKNEIIPFKEFALYVLPGEMINCEIYKSPEPELFFIVVSEGPFRVRTRNKWSWTAPDKTGVYSIVISNEAGENQMTLNIFVMLPFSQLKGEFLNGFRIGHYPNTAYQQLAIYEKPTGFIEITSQNENTRISPHFRIKQFLSKQKGDFPKYLVLKERLLLKLELILGKTNEKGLYAPTFEIMSGYRTPYYNKLIGNVKYSRHLWGGAADIFIDENPKDGIMDDINGDGIYDYQDAGVLYDIVDELYGKPYYNLLVGGLGRYTRTRHHGPFVHVDVRGVKVRWGD